MSAQRSIIFIVLSIFFSLVGCKNNADQNPEIDPMVAALPHGSALPDSKLSPEDQLKLANAVGRTVDTIAIQQLSDLLESSNNKLHLYAFWKLDCKVCIEQHKLFKKLQQEVGESAINLVFVNMDATANVSQVNASIRAQNVTQKAYILKELDYSSITAKYKKALTGALPSFILINNSDGTLIFYNEKFEYDELYALVQPLLI